MYWNRCSAIAPCIALLSDIHVTKTILSIRPTRMWGVQKMQGAIVEERSNPYKQLSRLHEIASLLTMT